MPETQKIRDRILRYLGENKQYVGEVLSGKKCGPKANSVLLVIVKALGIK